MSSQADRFCIGVAPPTSEAAGGIFQYAQTMLGVLAELRQERTERLVVLGNGLDRSSPLLAGADLEVVPLLPQTPAGRVYDRLARIARSHLGLRQRESLMAAVAWLRKRRTGSGPTPPARPAVEAWLRRYGVDLIVYPASISLAFEIDIPYVMAVHDLQHRIHPEFPEVTADGELEARENLYRHGIGGATIVLVDSEVGREDVLDHYGALIDPERVCVLPFLPSESCRRPPSAADRRRVEARYGLPERYLFYPAQLWPHKNHAILVRALGMLREAHGLEIPLVLVGSTLGRIRSETWRDVRRLARDLGLENAVVHLGYVPDEDMPTLYANATALTMPTWFGPTNIPILEAWAQGCPVLTSDIRGVREQAGDAAVLADPASAEDIAEGIRRLWVDADLRTDLVRRGYERLGSYTRADYAAALSRILDRAKSLALGARPSPDPDVADARS